jgi:hypothetical protein
MSNISITFKNNNEVLRDSLDLGTFQSLGVSQNFDLKINHNSNKPIFDCGIFLAPYSQYYAGTASKSIDYNKILWFADNFPGYGLFLKQEFTVYGEVYRQDSRRLIDVSRTEERDIFSGSQVQMLSGFSDGEVRNITSYDVLNNLFYLDDDFSAALEGDRFKIVLSTEHVFKSQQGSSEEYPIPLLFNAGRIDRFQEALITLELKIPPFIREPGRHFFDLNMKYTPGE